MFAYSDVTLPSAKIKNLIVQRIIAVLEFFDESDSSSLDSNLGCFIACQYLVESKFSACIFFEDIPVLNYVNQSCSPNRSCRLKIKSISRCKDESSL
jgi:hypothetical protein